MSLEDNVAALRALPLLADFGEDQLRLIAFNAQRRRFGDGAYLFRDGETARSAMLVLAGTVVLEGSRRAGETGRFGSGALLGEMALLAAVRRSGDARSQGESEVLEVPRPVFHRVLEEYPELAAHIRSRLAERVAAFLDDLKPVGARFAGLGTGERNV